MKLNEADLRCECLRSNLPVIGTYSTQTAVRLTYIPTGQSVTVDVCRSAEKNKAHALNWLEEFVEPRL